MCKRIALFSMLLLFGSVVSAQDCGNGLPCGNIPWDLPVYPELASPTPLVVTVNPSITPTVTPTPSPVPTATRVMTATPFFDSVPLDDSIATMNAVLGATDVPILNASGTPMANSQVVEIVEDSSLFWSYAKGLTAPTFGPIAPLVTLLLLSFTLSLMLALMKLIIPIIGATVGLARKFVQTVLDFIPG